MGLMGAIGLSSCQETSERQDREIADKIQSDATISADDYSRIIEYVGEYAQKAQKYVDMQINGEDQAEAKAGMDKLNAEYPFVDAFRNCLRQTPVSSLSDANLREVAKYVQYIEFSAPAGYTIETNQEAAGMEVATPDSVNGVIAGAVDTFKVER